MNTKLIKIAVLALALFLSYAVYASVTGTLRPISEGAYLQWTPSAGSAHYTLVDETTCNGTTDYNHTGTAGNRDSYGISFTAVSNGSVISQIAITPCASRNSSGKGGSSTMNVFYRYNGVNSADAGSYALTGTTPVTLSPTNFSGLSILKSSTSTLQIGAIYSSGTRGSRLSRISTVITYTALLAPTNFNAVNVSGSRNDLSWSDNSVFEDAFQVERSLNSQFGPFMQIATTSANAVSYSDTSVSADQTYYYRVRAVNKGGKSGYSLTDYAITATAVPIAPTDLVATASSTIGVLSWADNSTSEEGFKVERSSDNINFSEIASKGMNVTTHFDLNLASGTYHYRVYAHNLVGNSGYSNTASITIP